MTHAAVTAGRQDAAERPGIGPGRCPRQPLPYTAAAPSLSGAELDQSRA
jgi:hypothetical protein